MKEWQQGEASTEPTCALPANARRMQVAGERLVSQAREAGRLGGVVALVYGRCGDLDCGGSVSVRVAVLDDASGAPVVDYVGVWHDGKWFTGGARGIGLGVGYRDVMAVMKAAATPTLVVDIAPIAA